MLWLASSGVAITSFSGCRQAEGLVPLCDLLRGGPHNPAAANAANALASVVANNGINQDAAADVGVIEKVVQLLTAATASTSNSRASIEAMKALAALTDNSLPNQDRAVQAGAPAGLCQAALHLNQSEPAADPEAAWQLCKALACLVDDHTPAQQACTEAIAPVVSLLSHSDSAVLDQACQALACLVSECPEHQARAGQDSAIALLVGHLCDVGPAEEEDQRRWRVQVAHLLLALLVVATQVPDPPNNSSHDEIVPQTPVQLSTAQKFAVVSSFVKRHSWEPLVLALFTLVDQNIPLCKQTAIHLQQQSAEWDLQDWDLSKFRESMQAVGQQYHPDCLSCVGIPL